MSIIFGVFNLAEATDQTDKSAFESILKHNSKYCLFDDHRTWSSDRCKLGQLTIYNTPESKHENLPYFDPTNSLVIAADARIDNRQELSSLLNKDVSGWADSQVILECYKKWQKDCVKHLIGDYAFCIRDVRHNRLFCARDHLGVKPFFYTEKNNTLYISSLARGLSALPFVSQSTSSDYWLSLLLPTSRWKSSTYYADIKKLPPAHTLTVENDRISIKHYWYPTYSTLRFDTDEEYIHAFEQLLKRAVSDRLRSLSPIACQLSGGLDSSAILAIALSEKNSVQINSYTHTSMKSGKAFPSNKDDYSLAYKVSKYLDTDAPTKITVEKESFEALNNLQLALNGMPLGIVNMTLPTYLTCKTAKKNNSTTLLSGFLGDEGITSEAKDRLELILQDRDWRALSAILFESPLKTIKTLAKYFIASNIRCESLLLKKHMRSSFVNKVFIVDKLPISNDDSYSDNITSLKKKRFFEDYHPWKKALRDHVTDRFESEYSAAAAWGMENRYPLADIRLLELYHSLPKELKRRDNIGRWIFRKTLDKKLPDIITWGEKSETAAVPYIVDLKYNFKASSNENKNNLPQDQCDFVREGAIKNHFEEIALGKKGQYNGLVNFALQIKSNMRNNAL